MSVKEHLDALPEDWVDKFLEMYDTGCSDHEIMREFGISPKVWQLLMMSLGESQFAEVVEFGNALARAWWEREGRTNLGKRGFNTRLYDINMQNRWGWAKKQETSDSDAPMVAANDTALDRRIQQLKEQMAEGAEQ